MIKVFDKQEINKNCIKKLFSFFIINFINLKLHVKSLKSEIFVYYLRVYWNIQVHVDNSDLLEKTCFTILFYVLPSIIKIWNFQNHFYFLSKCDSYWPSFMKIWQKLRNFYQKILAFQIQKLAISKNSTIFVLNAWNLVKMNASWGYRIVLIGNLLDLISLAKFWMCAFFLFRLYVYIRYISIQSNCSAVFSFSLYWNILQGASFISSENL